MKTIKAVLFTGILLLVFSVNAQKIKIKKGIATVDKVAYLKVEKINSLKYFVSTLEGEEFLSINIESFGTGKYTNHTHGKNTEIRNWYSVFKFLDNEEIGKTFEVDEGRIKHLIKMMYNSNIIVNGKLSIEKAQRMIEKYSENVSERRFLTKN